MASPLSTSTPQSMDASGPSGNESRRDCQLCGKVFKYPHLMSRHLRTCKLRKNRTCGRCGHTFPNPSQLGQHFCSGAGKGEQLGCKLCKSKFTFRALIRHFKRGGCVNEGYRRKEFRAICVPDENGIVDLAFHNKLGDIFMKNIDDELDALEFMAGICDTVQVRIREYLEKWKGLKVNFALEAIYIKPTSLDTHETKDACFNSKSIVVTSTTNIQNLLEDTFAQISVEMDEFTTSGSGWMLEHIDGMLVKLSKYSPLEGGAYIKLPKSIQLKSAVRNMFLPGDQCFKHAILSSLFHDKSYRSEVNNPDLCHTFNFESINFPTPLSDILKFEINNNVSVNVYALNDKFRVFPLQISKFHNNPVQHFDLLLLKSDNNFHYCLITSLSKLVRSQKTLHNHQHLICKRCFTMFKCDLVTKDGLNAEQRKARHTDWCMKNAPTRVEMPNRGAVSSFSKFLHQQRVPIVVYADFEALVKPCSPPDEATSPSTSASTSAWSRPIATHEMYAVGVLVVSTVPTFQPTPDVVVMTGRDVVTQFMKFLSDLMKMVDRLYSTVVPMIITPKQKRQNARATNCGICNKPFDRRTEMVVRHHCHLTGNYICAAHRSCNLGVKIQILSRYSSTI
uniref:C2H2-type domain-containing protein n=1 Tax=Lygus hesperus TaxID=30085 RepID=A0A0A9VZB1_LYGHE